MDIGRTAKEVIVVSDSEGFVMFVTLDVEGTERKVFRRAKNGLILRARNRKLTKEGMLRPSQEFSVVCKLIISSDIDLLCMF
jgi:hypothetical protein